MGYTTVTGTLAANGDGFNGTIIAEIKNQLVLADGWVVPANSRISENVSAGAFTIDVPPTDTATPASQKVYFYFVADGEREEKYLGRKTIPTSATAVTFQSLS